MNSTTPIVKATTIVKPKFYYGYAIVVFSFLILMIVWGAQYSFGVFFKPILSEFGWNRAITSGAYSLNIFFIAVFGILSGRLCDKFGPRLVVTVCGSFVGISYLLMSQIKYVWQIYLFYGVLSSIGASGTWVPLMSVIARWFVKRRGFMSGIVAAGIGIGTMIMPLLANQLISAYSWRIAYIFIGSTSLLVIVIIAQFLKRDPGQIGQTAYGAVQTQSHYSDIGLQGFTLQKALRTRQFCMLAAVYFLLGFCLQTVLVHIVPHSTDIGISNIAAAGIISVIGAISIIGKIGIGGAIDRVGNRPIVIIVSSIMLVSLLWLQIASNLWMLYLFAVVFAFSYGGFASFQSPIVAELFGLKAHGVIFGMVICAANVGGSLGPILAGVIYDASGGYGLDFAILAGLIICCLIVAVLLRTAPRFQAKN